MSCHSIPHRYPAHVNSHLLSAELWSIYKRMACLLPRSDHTKGARGSQVANPAVETVVQFSESARCACESDCLQLTDANEAETRNTGLTGQSVD